MPGLNPYLNSKLAPTAAAAQSTSTTTAAAVDVKSDTHTMHGVNPNAAVARTNDIFNLSSQFKSCSTDYVNSGYTLQGLPFMVVSSLNTSAEIAKINACVSEFVNGSEPIGPQAWSKLKSKHGLDKPYKSESGIPITPDNVGILVIWEDSESQLKATCIGKGDFFFKDRKVIDYFEVGGSPFIGATIATITREFEFLGCTKLSEEVANKIIRATPKSNDDKQENTASNKKILDVFLAEDRSSSDNASFVSVVIPSQEMQAKIAKQSNEKNLRDQQTSIAPSPRP